MTLTYSFIEQDEDTPLLHMCTCNAVAKFKTARN